jgi:hypothetical protein
MINLSDLEIPTHIEFTLYRFDSIDSQIISVIKRDCTNFSIEESDSHFTVMASDFIDAIHSSPRLRKEMERWSGNIIGDSYVNSIYFIVDIYEKLANLEWISFRASDSKDFSRLVKLNDRDVVNFQFTIIEGYFDLSAVFSRPELDWFNRKCIELGIMENKYLARRPYFYMMTEVLIELLSILAIEGCGAAEELVEAIDDKLTEDNPMLLVKTDYTPY